MATSNEQDHDAAASKTADPTAPNTPTAPKDVDLGGDVNLVVGPAGCQVRLRVSKALLSIASKYFRALFGTAYSEGKAVEAGEDIVLEDDEPDAVANLCRILHMQYTWPKPMKPVELLHLAVVADKYDCVKAVELGLEALFPKNTTGMNFTEVGNLVVAAYILDHPHFFNKFTRIIYAGYTDSLYALATSETGQRIPVLAWLNLESRRTHAHHWLLMMISALIKRPCTADFRNCFRTSEWFSKITDVLKATGLDSIHSANLSIDTLLAKLAAVNVPQFNTSISACGTVVSRTNNQNYHPYPMNHATLKSALGELDRSVFGICLDCIKAEGRAQGKCRIEHG